MTLYVLLGSSCYSSSTIRCFARSSELLTVTGKKRKVKNVSTGGLMKNKNLSPLPHILLALNYPLQCTRKIGP